MAGTDRATPSNVNNNASEMPLATSLAFNCTPAAGDHAEAGDHALERAQQPDHRPQRAEHGQHADLLLHLGGDGLAHALHGLAGLGQAVGQFA